MIEVFWYSVREILPFCALAAVIYCAARIIFLKSRKRKPRSVPNELLRLFFVIYLAALAGLTLFPDTFWYDLFNAPELLGYDIPQAMFNGKYVGNFAIYRAIFEGYPANWAELALNVVLFVPLGFMLPMLNKKLKWWQVDLIGLGATCFIELVQPVVGREGDLDDIITNTTGAVIGCAIAKLLTLIIKKNSGKVGKK